MLRSILIFLAFFCSCRQAYAQNLIKTSFNTEDDINQRIDYQINSFTQQYGSIANIEKIYGMSIDRIKKVDN